jgi:hypothetical protein
LDPQQPNEEYEETKSVKATNPRKKLTKSAVQKCDAQPPHKRHQDAKRNQSRKKEESSTRL